MDFESAGLLVPAVFPGPGGCGFEVEEYVGVGFSPERLRAAVEAFGALVQEHLPRPHVHVVVLPRVGLELEGPVEFSLVAVGG